MAKAKRFKEKARRAKKSEMPKKLLLVPVTLAVVGASAIGMNEYTRFNTTENIASKIEKYELNDFSYDIFTEENTKYLPIIYSDPYEQVTKADIERELNKRGMKVISISSEVIGTGTTVQTENATYTVLIYGDTDGNGQVNVRDVQAIVKHLLYGNGSELKGVKATAANVDKSSELINVRDAQRIVQFILGKKGIVDSIPTSDINADKEKPVITLNGEKDVTINVFEEYNDEGAQVTDNLDPNVQIKVSSNVNKDKPGDYVVVYSAVDASGNEAEIVSRNVHVVDYIKEIQIVKNPKTEYVNGEDITLEGMEAYAVKAYEGKAKTPIDLKEVTFAPSKATMETKEITFTYRGYTQTIKINVIERAPKITLKGDRNIVLKAGEEYSELGATAVDDLDGEVKVTISGTVNKDVPGTYEITYSATNSLGKTTVDKRVIEVVDYITEAGVEFEVSADFKKDYIEEDVISANGIKVFANYKVANRKDITSEVTVTFNPEKAEYGKNEIVASCKIYDKIAKKDVEYSSDPIDVNVLKKFQSVKVVDGTTRNTTGEVYQEVLVATIKEGDNEDKIDIDKIKVEVENKDTDIHEDGSTPCEAEVRKEPNADGTVNIYFKGVTAKDRSNPYLIKVTPPEETNAIYFEMETTVNDLATSADVVFKTTADGSDVIKVNNTDKGTRFKEGDTIVAELTFKHKYDDKHTSIIPNFDASKITNANIVVKGGDTAHPGVSIESITNNSDGNVEIRIKSTANQTNANAGQFLNLVFVVNNEPGEPTVSATVETKIYPTSVYDVKVKNSNNSIMNGLTLSLKEPKQDGEIVTIGDNRAQSINGKYYTIAKINKDDQYVTYDGSADLPFSCISNRESDITNNVAAKDKVVFSAKKSANDYSSNLDIIGLVLNTETGKYVESTGNIEYVGIAIQDINNAEDNLENADLRVYFEDNLPLELGKIAIERKDISSIEYVADTFKKANYCYEDMEVAKIKTGAKQKAFTQADLDNIKCIITKQGSETDLSKTKDVGISKTISGGVVTISFWAKESGTYEITPIYIDEEIQASTYVTATVNEDMSVTRVAFKESKDSDDLADGTFGNVAAGNFKRNIVTFYHDYSKKAEAKTGITGIKDERPVSVNYKKVGFGTLPAGIEKIEKIYDNTVISPDSALESATVEEIRITVKSDASVPSKITFKLTVDNSEYKEIDGITAKKDYDEDFVISVNEKAVIDHLKVGNSNNNSEDIYICTTAEGKANAPKGTIIQQEDDGLYYTIIPIRYETKGNVYMYSDNLDANKISMRKADATNNTNITFIDNLNNSTGIVVSGRSQIKVKGMTYDSDTKKYVDVGTSGVMEYIGIAVSTSSQMYLGKTPVSSAPDNVKEAWESTWRLKTITVTYNGTDVKAPTNKTFTIQNTDVVNN